MISGSGKAMPPVAAEGRQSWARVAEVGSAPESAELGIWRIWVRASQRAARRVAAKGAGACAALGSLARALGEGSAGRGWTQVTE